jgi:hypothetical protein
VESIAGWAKVPRSIRSHAHQVWAAAAPFLILQACLGISINAERRRIVFDDPYLPEGIPNLAINDLRCNGTRVDLFLERRNDSVLVHKTGTAGASRLSQSFPDGVGSVCHLISDKSIQNCTNRKAMEHIQPPCKKCANPQSRCP